MLAIALALLKKAAPYIGAVLFCAAVFFAIRADILRQQQLKTDLAAAQQQLANAKVFLAVYQEQVREANRLAEKRAEEAQRIRTVTKEIIHEVQVRIPADACPLPPDWRVLHNAAAAGQAPASAPSR